MACRCFFSCVLFAALLISRESAAQDRVVLKTKDGEVAFSRSRGTLESIRIGEEELLAPGGVAVFSCSDPTGKAMAAPRPTGCKVKKNQIHFSFRTGEIEAESTVTASASGTIDFDTQIKPLRNPVSMAAAIGSFSFDLKNFNSVVCHVPRPRNVGMELNELFFRRQSDLGNRAALIRRKRGPGAYDAIFGSGAVIPPKVAGFLRHPAGDAAAVNEWLDPISAKKLARFWFCDLRPFAPGQAEIVFLRDHDRPGETAFGGSRLGGKGAIFRFGGAPTTENEGQTLLELYTGLAKRIAAEKAAPPRKKVFLVTIDSGAFAFPAFSEWEQAFRRAFPKLEPIQSAEAMQKALDDPETMLIVNPWREACFFTPQSSPEEFGAKVASYVRNGGFWFEAGGYSFFYELTPAGYLTTGRQSVPSAIADFFHFTTKKQAGVSIYSIQPPGKRNFDPSSIYMPVVFELGGAPEGGFLNRNFVLSAQPGMTCKLPTTRLRFGATALEAAAHFARDNRVDTTLQDKAPAKLLEQLKKSVILLDQPPLPQTARALFESLDRVPRPSVIHIARYLHGTFDKGYPDHLPPNPKWGTPQDLARLIAECHAKGLLFMPYINNTWWCDLPKGPTFQAEGDAALLRRQDGSAVAEVYGNNRGWNICMWHPAVRRANDKILRQFTVEYPVDVIFQDQCGARGFLDGVGNPRLDYNAASPAPHAATEGILSTVRHDSAAAKLATEEGWYALLNDELFFCGFTMGLERFWFRVMLLRDFYPSTHWRL
ncbi:MAG: DUF6259 domain-containing protein, partial [Victivallaceae bacterium]|nr:DUF6259 domain-containing protein [Victivallaceae bacterium]